MLREFFPQTALGDIAQRGISREISYAGSVCKISPVRDLAQSADKFS